MEDMAKIRYLVVDGKGSKLRRIVPSDLRALVGQTAWVERLGSISATELRERANRFSWKTDNEIHRLRSQLRDAASRMVEGRSLPVEIKLQLSDEVAEEIARTYFIQIERARTMSRMYMAPGDDVLRSEFIEEAGLDYAYAASAARGEEHIDAAGSGTRTFATAWELLAENGLLPKLEGRRKAYPQAVLANESFQLLCRLVERANLELSSRRYQALTNGHFPELRDNFFRLAQEIKIEHPRVEAPPIKTVEDLIVAFEERKAQQVGASRLYQYRLAFRAMREELGSDFPLVDITRQHCQGLADLFVVLPPHATQHFEGHTLRSAIEAFYAKNGAYASRAKEAQKPLSILKSIFALAVQNDWLDKSPAARVEILLPAKDRKQYLERSSGYQPFELAELQLIFGAPLYTGCIDDEDGFNKYGSKIIKRHRYWVPLISLWTGMRMNEALQLERGDLRKQDDIYYLSVTDEEEVNADSNLSIKRVKNRNAIRGIPIHPELKRLGFIEWVQARDPGRLFPEATAGHGDKASNQFSKRFATFLKSRGIWNPRKKVFHSFRNNFNDALRECGVSEEMRRAINGWSGQASMDDRYGRGHKVHRLYEEVRKARYEGLNLNHLAVD